MCRRSAYQALKGHVDIKHLGTRYLPLFGYRTVRRKSADILSDNLAPVCRWSAYEADRGHVDIKQLGTRYLPLFGYPTVRRMSADTPSDNVAPVCRWSAYEALRSHVDIKQHTLDQPGPSLLLDTDAFVCRRAAY